MPHDLNRKHKLTASEVRSVISIVIGLSALMFYYSWWFREARLTSPWLFLAFIIALFFGGIQIWGNWLVYLATHYRPQIPPPPADDLSVDVFVTACGEEYALIERAVVAACAMRGNHKTWLLDDGHDPALARLARQLGIGYLARQDRQNAKAGNLNAALARTEGDIVVIFDIDHAPKLNFLERTLGYFRKPEVGFVQVMLTFENNQDGWVAQAAGESTHDFYNPTSIGADGVKSATLIGTNALIRRKALESIGGYQPGLAEDLETSIALHAAGWHSTYVAEPLAPGFSPPDLAAWFTQQFKWARGVFESLLTAYPRHFPHLKPGQRLFYSIRMTYYWLGIVTCIHLFATLFALLGGNPNFLTGFQVYLSHFLPLFFVSLLIRIMALQRWRHWSLRSNLQGKAIALVFMTWPIYTLAWLMALLRIPLGFRPTPKNAIGGLNPLWLLPQFITTLLSIIGILYHLFIYEGPLQSLVLGFALAQTGVQLLFFSHYLAEILMIRVKAMMNTRRSGVELNSSAPPIPSPVKQDQPYPPTQASL